MKVTRHVIVDLLPLYLGDEASADTRTLVEAFFEIDPEFARLARTRPEALLPRLEPALPAMELEMRALTKTRELLSARAWLQGLALFFTLLPFSFIVEGEQGFRWIFLHRLDAVMVIAALAVASWLAWFVLRQRLRASGV